MKVRELQNEIGKLDPELDVLFYCDDEEFSNESNGFTVFDCLDITKTKARRLRLDNGKPYLEFDGKNLEDIILIGITQDF